MEPFYIEHSSSAKKSFHHHKSHLNRYIFVVFLEFVEDDDVLFVEVRNVELGFVDDAIEGVTHGVLVLVHESETVSASEGVFNVFHVGGLVGQGSDGDEDGEWHTSAFALGEEETAGVSAVTVDIFVVVLSFTLDGIDYVLVHVADGGVIFDGGQDVSGVADDVVLSDGHGVGESVEFDHEFPLVVQVQNATFGIVFGADEDADHDVGLFVGNNVDLVGEGFVVQPVLAGLDDDVFLVFADSDGVADVDVEVIEVGDEFVDFDRVDLDSGEGEFIVLVDGEVALVSEEDLGDGGQDAVVQGIAEDGFVVFQNSGGDLVTMVVIDDVSEELNGKGVQFSVVVVVDGVDGGLDHVSEDVDTVSVVDGNLFSLVGVDVSEIDGVDDSPFEVLDAFILKNTPSTPAVFDSEKCAEEITLTIGQAFDLAYKKFLESGGKDVETRKQIGSLQKRIQELETENSELKKQLQDLEEQLMIAHVPPAGSISMKPQSTDIFDMVPFSPVTPLVPTLASNGCPPPPPTTLPPDIRKDLFGAEPFDPFTCGAADFPPDIQSKLDEMQEGFKMGLTLEGTVFSLDPLDSRC